MEDWPPEDDAFDFETGGSDRPRPEQDPYDTGEYGRRRRSRQRSSEPIDPFRTGVGSGEDPLLDTGEARTRARERGEPWDTGEYRVRRAARRRHRDLPAKVRRRQVFGLGAIILLVIGGLYLAFAGGGDDEGGDEGPPLKEVVGQTIVTPVGDAGVEKKLIRKVRKGWTGGIIFVGEALVESDVQRDAGRLQKAAREGGHPPLLIMLDQEGGFVKKLPGPPDLSPDEIADEGPETAQEEGQKTGEYLRGLGVNADLAPVLDTGHDNTEDTIVSRVFSEDPAEVGELGSAFITGLQSQQVAATAKHFPGMGLATQNTDFADVTVAATPEELGEDIEPFRQAVEAGVDMVMVSTAVYPDLSGERSAAFSTNVVTNELRTKLGFEGVVVTDDLEAPGSSAANAGAGAIQTLDAGGDLALFAQSSSGAARSFTAVVKAVKGGRLDQETVEAAYDRILALKQKLG